MKKYEKCYIFFDTNTFEYRQSDKLLLTEIRASKLFYDVLNAIELLGLSDKVQVCIPEIVLEEVKLHMIDEYKAEIDSLNFKIKEAQQVLGELVDISCEFNEVNGVSGYKQYVEDIAQEFISNPKNKVVIIKYPNDADTLDMIVDKALHGTPPFTTITASKKKYSDAGFKDALIWETVNQMKGEELIVFVTKDFDFKKVDRNNINICSKSIELKNLLISNMNVSSDVLFLTTLLDSKSELVHRIITESGFEGFKSVTVDPLIEHWIDKDDEGKETSVLNIICDIIIDNDVHKFTIRYDINANELIDAYCEM